MNKTRHKFDFTYFSNLPENKKIGFIRHWLSLNPDSSEFKNNNFDLWMTFIKMSCWDCVREIIDHEHCDINAKDIDNRGWLHYAIYHSMPDKLAIFGLSKLNKAWNKEDKYQNKPMEIFPTPQLAHAMARRYWSEVSLNDFTSTIKKLKKSSETTNHLDLMRVWDFWLNE